MLPTIKEMLQRGCPPISWMGVFTPVWLNYVKSAGSAFSKPRGTGSLGGTGARPAYRPQSVPTGRTDSASTPRTFPKTSPSGVGSSSVSPPASNHSTTIPQKTVPVGPTAGNTSANPTFVDPRLSPNAGPSVGSQPVNPQSGSVGSGGGGSGGGGGGGVNAGGGGGGVNAGGGGGGVNAGGGGDANESWLSRLPGQSANLAKNVALGAGSGAAVAGAAQVVRNVTDSSEETKWYTNLAESAEAGATIGAIGAGLAHRAQPGVKAPATTGAVSAAAAPLASEAFFTQVKNHLTTGGLAAYLEHQFGPEVVAKMREKGYFNDDGSPTDKLKGLVSGLVENMDNPDQLIPQQAVRKWLEENLGSDIVSAMVSRGYLSDSGAPTDQMRVAIKSLVNSDGSLPVPRQILEEVLGKERTDMLQEKGYLDEKGHPNQDLLKALDYFISSDGKTPPSSAAVQLLGQLQPWQILLLAVALISSLGSAMSSPSPLGPASLMIGGLGLLGPQVVPQSWQDQWNSYLRGLGQSS